MDCRVDMNVMAKSNFFILYPLPEIQLCQPARTPTVTALCKDTYTDESEYLVLRAARCSYRHFQPVDQVR